MFKAVKKLVQYPRLTQDYPAKPLDTDLFIGAPEIEAGKCTRCGKCVSACPTGAIVPNNGSLGIALDRCVFCVECEEVCPTGAVRMTRRFELAARSRSTLVIEEDSLSDGEYDAVSEALKRKIKRLFGRSLQIREVDSGSCNGCDYEVNALNNPVNDIERLGISFVASPRHADMLLVTGAAVRNMQVALEKTYEAAPDPKLVVAVGACACSGGIFRDTYASCGGVDRFLPVDVYIPGCPPRPQAILYGILKALDRV